MGTNNKVGFLCELKAQVKQENEIFKKLKEEFTFKYHKKIIFVKVMDGGFYAISGGGNKPLLIAFTNAVHIGIIKTIEGVFLGFLNTESIKPNELKTIIIDKLLNSKTVELLLKIIKHYTQLKLKISKEGVSWIEYDGQKIKGTEKEFNLRFTPFFVSQLINKTNINK